MIGHLAVPLSIAPKPAPTTAIRVEPLEAWLRKTLGNSLRRVLLLVVAGAAGDVGWAIGRWSATEFQRHSHTIKEDVIEILLNLKEALRRLATVRRRSAAPWDVRGARHGDRR